MTTPEQGHEEIVQEDCILSKQEIRFLRRSEVQNDVTTAINTLKEDMFCVNLDRLKTLKRFLNVQNQSTSDIVSSYMSVLGSNSEMFKERYEAIDLDEGINGNYKELLKCLLLVRCLIQPVSATAFVLPKLPSAEQMQTLNQNPYEFFQSTNFWHDLYEFQKETDSLSDCIIGPKTCSALFTRLPEGIQSQATMNKESMVNKEGRREKRRETLHQEFYDTNIQAYAAQRKRELDERKDNGETVNESADFCSGFVNGVLTDIAFKKGRTYSFPENEGDAREKDKDFKHELFVKQSLSMETQDELFSTLVSAPEGSVITVQNSASKRKDKGVTHALISLGNGQYKELVGSVVNVVTISKENMLWDSEHACRSLEIEGKQYRFIESHHGKPGSTMCTPEFQKFPAAEFHAISLERRKKQYKNNVVEIAKSLAKSYGGSTFYRIGVLGTKVLDDKTIQVPVKKGSSELFNDKYEEVLTSADHYTPSENLKEARAKLSTYGIPISDNDLFFLDQINYNERRTGGKRRIAETIASSYHGKYRASLIPGVDVPKSLGPFQINMDTFKALVKQNPALEKALHGILEKEGLNDGLGGWLWGAKDKSLSELGYERIKRILLHPVASLYIASELLKQNRLIVRAKTANVSVKDHDVGLTAQMMYNLGPETTYGAVLQQELYKVCKKLGCAVPEEFSFDGRYGLQSKQLLDCVNQIIFKDSMEFVTNRRGVIIGLKSGDTKIPADNTVGLVNFFRDNFKTPDNESYYPALEYDFLKQLYKETNNKVRAHYVQSTVKNTEKTNRANNYKGVEMNKLYDPDLQRVVNNKNVNYRLKDDRLYDPETQKGHFDCLDFVKYHLSDKEKGWKTGSCRMKNEFSFHDMFRKLRISGYVTPQKYGSFNEFKNMVYNVRVGDVVGIGHIYEGTGAQEIKRINQKMSMSHGGVVSRIEKNNKGEVVQVRMMHSSGVDEIGGKGPTEVPLFGPGGYYETVCNPNDSASDKRILVFGYEGDRNPRKIEPRGGERRPQV